MDYFDWLVFLYKYFFEEFRIQWPHRPPIIWNDLGFLLPDVLNVTRAVLENPCDPEKLEDDLNEVTNPLLFTIFAF